MLNIFSRVWTSLYSFQVFSKAPHAVMYRYINCLAQPRTKFLSLVHPSLELVYQNDLHSCHCWATVVVLQKAFDLPFPFSCDLQINCNQIIFMFLMTFFVFNRGFEVYVNPITNPSEIDWNEFYKHAANQ